VCSNFPTNQSIHLLHWSLKRRPKSSRTRGCDSGRSSTSTISPSGLRSRSWQLTTGSRYVEARYTTVNICVVTSIGREPVKGLREDVVEDDRFWEGAVVGVIYYCFDYLSQNHHRFRRLALNEDMEYEVGSAESVSTAVVRAVSAVDGRKPSSLPPLSHVLDPDALDALFDSHADGEPRTGGRLSFIYCRCRITLDNGEFLTIQPLNNHPRTTSDRESSCIDRR